MNGELTLQIRIELEAIITEREAMLIENKARELLGEAPAYGENSFRALSGEIYNLIGRLR